MGKATLHKNISNQSNSNGTVEVLYQKMGDRWFAFSLVDGEVFVGSISQDQLESPQLQTAANHQKLYKISGNS